MSEKQLHSELKKEFQLERLILFSDAVFAIAITLLVIELKVPEIPKQLVTEQLLLDSLDHLIPKFIGFVISFMIIGMYWTVHHRMFGYVKNFTRRTLWLNLWFLFAVALMPFSTAFYSEYVLRMLRTPLIIYTFNICLLGFLNLALWKHLNNPKLNLVENVDLEDLNYFSLRAVISPFIFIFFTIVYFIKPAAAIFIPFTIPIIIRLIKRRSARKKAASKMVETNTE